MHEVHIPGAGVVPLKTQPWQHQLDGLEFAYPMDEVMLAYDMGTGKTKVAIDLMTLWNVQSAVILCPKAVISTWPKQFGIHSARDVEVITLDGNETCRDKVLKAERGINRAISRRRPYVVVMNYELCWRIPMDQWLLDMNTWDCVICDESHKIKSATGKATSFAAKLGLRTRKRVCLTGTPMPHSPLDVFGQYRFLNPGVFGKNFTMFKRYYAITGGYNNYQIIGYRNLDRLNEKFYSRARRVMAEDVLDLPEMTEETIEVELEAKALKTYRDMAVEMVAQIASGEITAANAMVKMLRLMQITSGFLPSQAPDGETLIEEISTAKLDALKTILEGIRSDEPIAIFTTFRPDVDRIKKAITEERGENAAEISGRMDDKHRFQNGEVNSVVVNIKSGGAGIDLTRAKYVVYFGHGLSLGDFLQSMKRVHRPGLNHPIFVYHLLVKGSVDVRIYRALERKEEVIESVLKQVKTELEAEEEVSV